MPAQTTAPKLVDHFFRNEYGRAVSFLTSKFGSHHLELAEDAVQEALIRAMQTWSFGKIPQNPTGWILRASQNKMIDHLRRAGKVSYEEQPPDMQAEDTSFDDETLNDDVIKMMFACSNPKLSTEYQIILILKILCGLSIKEIASALLKKEDAVAKAYTRSKKRFQEENLSLDLPSTKEIKGRLRVVLKSIYLLFNEGYKRTEGNMLISRDLCQEAMRLNDILLASEKTHTVSGRSLMALMCFHVSRFESRLSSDGKIISLEKQDRTKWDKKLIKLGNQYLNSMSKEEVFNEYFLQAAISGIHCNAKRFEDTNWKSILNFYNLLYRLNPNPMIALNRVVPYEKVYGSEEALSELKKIESTTQISEHYLFFAIKADLLKASGQLSDAKAYLEKAIEKTKNQNEREYLLNKLKSL